MLSELLELKKLIQNMEEVYDLLESEKNRKKQAELKKNIASLANQFKEKVSSYR